MYYWPKSKLQIVLTVLLTLAFLGSGITKLAGMEQARVGFESWGYPIFLMYLIGICEVAGAAGMWLRRFSYAAKICFILLMLGAVSTHLIFDTFMDAIPAIVLLVLTAVAFGLHHKDCK